MMRPNIESNPEYMALELRLMRKNFARLLDECADQMDGKAKKRARYPEYLRAVAASLRDQQQ